MTFKCSRQSKLGLAGQFYALPLIVLFMGYWTVGQKVRDGREIIILCSLSLYWERSSSILNHFANIIMCSFSDNAFMLVCYVPVYYDLAVIQIITSCYYMWK